MDSRLTLQTMLEELIGSRNVYFQPPESIRLNYPAIVYSRNEIRNKHADNVVYMQNHSYELTVIDEDPDSDVVERVSQLPLCRHNRHYKSDNLNHDVFILFWK